MEKPVAREELCSWIWPLKGVCVCVCENERVSTTETENKQARKGTRDEG